MNSLKNLMIIAVLTAVGYGVYVSLARNNAEVSGPTGFTEGPQVEMPSVGKTSSAGGSLALGERSSPPIGLGTPNFGVGSATRPSAAPTALSAGNPLAGAPAVVPVTPYPSTSPPLVPPGSSPADSSSPLATLGVPVLPDALAAMPTNAAGAPLADAVRNLAPPPSGVASSQAMFNPPPLDMEEGGSVAPPAGSPADTLLQSKFSAFMEAVQKKLDEGKFAEAHLALSTLYGNPDLPANQAKQITELLDQLAGTVIYSRQHYLEPAYVTQQGDTLDKVAQRYGVPWLLLARINGLAPSGVSNADSPVKDQPLQPGTELKVVRGPFEAVVHLETHELTLLVQNRYAGRFAIGVGRDQPSLDGNYMVCDKTLSPTYRGPDGVTINANDPTNPLGGAWIGLTDRIGIHGTSDPRGVGRDDNRGTLCVGERDLQDLYGILSVGSRVTILK